MHPSNIWAVIMQPGEFALRFKSICFCCKVQHRAAECCFQNPRNILVYNNTSSSAISEQTLFPRYNKYLPNNRSLNRKSYGGNINVITL